MRYLSDNGRRSIRCPDYDYSRPGFYFITICTYERECLFGDVQGDKAILNEAGRIARDEWLKTPQMRKNIALDEFIIMPNHLHGIVVIKYRVRRGVRDRGALSTGVLQYARTDAFSSPTQTLGSMVRGFKGLATVKINSLFEGGDRAPVWHRNFHDHIIRGKRELSVIRDYIKSNPANWQRDLENPSYNKNLSKKEFPRLRREHYSVGNFS